jgi:hypothetical protein
MVKPMDFENFIETAKVLRAYWLKANRQPEANRADKQKSTADGPDAEKQIG